MSGHFDRVRDPWRALCNVLQDPRKQMSPHSSEEEGSLLRCLNRMEDGLKHHVIKWSEVVETALNGRAAEAVINSKF